MVSESVVRYYCIFLNVALYSGKAVSLVASLRYTGTNNDKEGKYEGVRRPLSVNIDLFKIKSSYCVKNFTGTIYVMNFFC